MLPNLSSVSCRVLPYGELSPASESRLPSCHSFSMIFKVGYWLFHFKSLYLMMKCTISLRLIQRLVTATFNIFEAGYSHRLVTRIRRSKRSCTSYAAATLTK